MIWFWDRSIDFSDILLDKKLCKEKCENILIYGISYKASTSAKPLRIRFDKIDLLNYLYRCIIHYKIRYSVLFDYSYYGKVCDKIVLIIIFQESELLHMVLYLIKKILTFQMGQYLLSHLLIRAKITTTIIYF